MVEKVRIGDVVHFLEFCVNDRRHGRFRVENMWTLDDGRVRLMVRDLESGGVDGCYAFEIVKDEFLTAVKRAV
jgi:hypothetical protein